MLGEYFHDLTMIVENVLAILDLRRRGMALYQE